MCDYNIPCLYSKNCDWFKKANWKSLTIFWTRICIFFELSDLSRRNLDISNIAQPKWIIFVALYWTKKALLSQREAIQCRVRTHFVILKSGIKPVKTLFVPRRVIRAGCEHSLHSETPQEIDFSDKWDMPIQGSFLSQNCDEPMCYRRYERPRGDLLAPDHKAMRDWWVLKLWRCDYMVIEKCSD